jgi:hypothetical protein
MLEIRPTIGLQNPNITRSHKDTNVSINAALKTNDSSDHVPSMYDQNTHIEGGLKTNEMRKDLNLTPLINGTQNNYSSRRMRVLVARQDDSKMTAFVMKKEDPMRKLFKRYSILVGVEASCLRFLFDGYKVKHVDTPTTLQMKNNDILEVYQLESNGGKCYFKNCRQNKNT